MMIEKISKTMDSIVDMIDKNDWYKFIIFIAISFMLLIGHGIDKWQYLTYNIQSYVTMVEQASLSNALFDSVSNHSSVYTFFILVCRPLLQIPVFFLIMSVLVKSSIFFMVYRIGNLLLKDPCIAFVASLLFVLSSAYFTHGLVVNGIWGSPIFFPASVSTLFSLSGIYFALKHRLILSSVLFCLSINFHLLYGFTTLIIFISGYLLYFWKERRSEIKLLLIPSLLIVFNLLYLYTVNFGSSGVTFPIEIATMSEWYQYVYSVDPDDMSLLYTLQTSGYALLPLIAVALYLSFSNRSISPSLKYMFWGCSVTLSLFVGVELLHYWGFFFGKITEYFIIVQFRRGLWVLMLFALLIISDSLFHIKKPVGENTWKEWFIIFSFIGAYLVAWYWIVGLFLVVFVLIKPDWKSAVLIVIYLGALSIYYKSIFFQAPNINLSVKTCLFILTVLAVSSMSYRWGRFSKRTLMIIPIVLFVAMLTASGLLQHNYNDFSVIANNGPFRYPDHQQLSIDVYKEQGFSYDQDMVSKYREANPDHLPLLLPPDKIIYGDNLIFGSPLFLSRHDVATPMFSKKDFELLMYKLELMGAKGSFNDLQMGNEFYSKEEFLDIVGRSYDSLFLGQLQKLHNDYGVGFILTKTNYPTLELIAKNDSYNLYKLNFDNL